MEYRKLFVGGISWDTSEEHLREYFEAFGKIEEAVVMRDRSTGRSRGFGFVVFTDASVAEKAIKEKHVIDGRTVEVKKAVPRDDLPTPNRSNSSHQGSPGLASTKKIFVGGLASTVTESDFKKYFEQFGKVTDVVVMYDHNTQRPRGFGFITYDSEEAVDKVRVRPFHELNGKMVEVKQAVPKELSPGPTRSPFTHGMNRASTFLNAYLSNSPSGMDMRMNRQINPAATVGQNRYPSYGPGNHGSRSNLDSGFGLNNGLIGGDSGFGYRLGMNSYFTGNSGRYSPIPFDVSSGGSASFMSTPNGNVWGNQNPNYGANLFNPNDLFSNAPGIVGGFGSAGEIRRPLPLSSKGGRDSSLISGNDNYQLSGRNISGRTGYARNNAGSSPPRSSYGFINNLLNGGGIGDHYALSGDHGWLSSSPQLEGFTPFGYGHSNATAAVAANVAPKNSVRFAARPNPGIAA